MTPFVPISKFSEVLVDWKAPKSSTLQSIKFRLLHYFECGKNTLL